MAKTKFVRKDDTMTSEKSIEWVKKNILPEKIPLSITVSKFTGKIIEFEVGKTLSTTKKAQLIAKFPELEGKEI
tara:strand:- start:64 stop:285 length:222 start_codon:yes stop_codon:yes gene_type:complete